MREGVKNFINSPAWTELKAVLSEFWSDYNSEGWDNASHNFFQKADFEGEAHALETMGLEQGCTVQEIRKRFRDLSLIWHPDQHPEDQKEMAQEKFIELENAKEILIKIANRKAKKF
ncbi:DnaJ-like subfamily C member 22 [Oopsacas minuta]|uniref:DnaJ-like subfamily C member 22 n=1 Tax=Oopsacas minuta TaxID=111878 RepID=A0AAV7KDT3_9METZ|nr:DnaJ-like subfamily C member 22 [Oopsacas minuta]